MAQSALRALTQQLMQGGPAPSGMASAQTAIQNAAQRPQSSADLLGGLSQFTSLDTPQDMSLGATAADIALGFAPGIGTAQGIRDFERARRDDDMLGMALGGLSAFPVVGGIVKAGRGIGRAAEGAMDMSQASKYVATKMPTGVYSVTGKNDIYRVDPSGNEFTIEYVPQWKSKVKPFQVKGGSIDEVVSLADQRLDRSYNAQKGSTKYQKIPESWTGEAKKIAKKTIDAGYEPIFSASTQSRSKYMEINGQKIRLSDHDLPLHYDAPDIDFRYGSDINDLLNRL